MSSEGLDVYVYQISWRYLIPRLSYNYFRFPKTNGRHMEILLPVSILTCRSSSASHFASAYQIWFESDHRWRNYDVTKISKMAAVDGANELPVPVCLCTCPQKVRISKCTKLGKKYLNPRLSYNYLRFRKTNGRYIEILLPVSILTCQSSSASRFASAERILCESDHRRRRYDVINVFKMAAVDVANQLPVPFWLSIYVLRRSGSLSVPSLVKISQSTAEL